MNDTVQEFRYPDEIKPLLLETRDLIFEDGTRVTSEQIWNYITVEGPRRFPYAYTKNLSFGEQFSDDFTFMSGIRNNYIKLSFSDRANNLMNQGKPLILVQGGMTSDLYYAAGCLPVWPMFLRKWIVNTVDGRQFREVNVIEASLLEKAKKTMASECCNLISYVGLLKTEHLPISAIAPCLTSRCSDMAYALEDYRTGTNTIPTFIMDYPSNYAGGESRVEYLKEEIHSLVKKLAGISGKEVTDTSFLKEIKRHNHARKLARECQKIWWKAKVPPTCSYDNSFAHLALMGSFDYSATNQILEEAHQEIKKRVLDGVKGQGLFDDPVRLFICGSCACANGHFVDRKGGVIVGNEDLWSSISVDVKETGDPYDNLAVALSNLPYEKSTEERAEWTAKQIKESRADGVLFVFNWGCNYQSAVAGIITDIIKKETGLPVMSIEVGELTRMESIEQSQNRYESFIEMLQ